MKTVQIDYQGALRTKATHLKSESQIVTDAPTDNHGKGETFSPTDLLATSYLACMITVVGIAAEKNQMQLGRVSGDVKKIMAANPRRVAALEILLNFDGHNLNDTDKILVENTAINCPVAMSVHPDMVVQVKFQYN